MKRLMFALIIILLSGSHVWCGPFVSCECTPAVDKVLDFQTQLNNGTWVTGVAAVMTCGTNPATKVTCTGDQRTLCMDLASVPNGPFTVKARARNAWEVSADSLPLVDTKATPSSPSSLRIIQ